MKSSPSSLRRWRRWSADSRPLCGRLSTRSARTASSESTPEGATPESSEQARLGFGGLVSCGFLLAPLRRTAPLALGPDPGEKLARRLVGGILRHQFALEGPLQYGLAQPRRTLQIRLHLGFDLLKAR